MVQGGSKPESLLAARRRSPTVVLTVGHSTRSQEDFIALLQAHAVKRLLIADALLAHGYRVEEIVSLKRTRPHVLTSWARVKGAKIIYPPAQGAAQQEVPRKRDAYLRT